MSKRVRPVIVNHYKTLEVHEEGDEAEIKKAYRSLVLRWHPDKHRESRAAAEEKIRLINAAYEVLSNPTKKDTYDMQRGAMEGKPMRKKAKVNPKLNIPKEFMMQPLGHPEKFLKISEEDVVTKRRDGLKVSDQTVTVEARQDSELEFDDFFQATKFSLWWLPEVNNSCRIRALGSKAAHDTKKVARGLAGGLNIAFKFNKGNQIEATVSLIDAQKGQKVDAVNFVAVSSPNFEGAYRFESVSRKCCFLGYSPPNRLGVINLEKDEDTTAVLDFMLVDFSVMSKFIDTGEVFEAAMRQLAKDHEEGWVKLSNLREHAKVKTYFETVLKTSTMWEIEDFVSYFNGHWMVWEYRETDQYVRLRPSSEKLGQCLATANGADEVASVISGVGDDLSNLTLVEAERVVKMLSQATGGGTEVAQRRRSALERLVAELPSVAAKALKQHQDELSAAQLLYLREQVLRLAPPSSGQPSRAASLLAELMLRAEGLEGSVLAALDAQVLLQLAVAATKLPAGAERAEKLGLLVGAASAKLAAWSAVDVIQLLLASAKAKQDMPLEAKQLLLKQAAESLKPQLKELASAEVLKLVLAISGEGPSSELLTLASREAIKRCSDFPQAQLLLLTQALTQGLGHQHEVVLQLLDFWAEVLPEADSASAGGQKALSADQLVRLGHVATLVSSSSEASAVETSVRLFEALGSRLMRCVASVSASGRAQLQEQLESSDGLGKFSGKKQLLSELASVVCS